MKKQALFLIFLAFCIQGVFAQKYLPGYYYDHSGNRHNGFIKQVYHVSKNNRCINSIYFKARKKQKKAKLFAKDAKAFVIKKDSFALVEYIPYEHPNDFFQGFAEVIEVGKVSLLLNYSKVATGNGVSGGVSLKSTYLITRYGKTIAINKKKDFQNILSTFIADAPDLVSLIKNNQLQQQDIRVIVKAYNARF